MLKAEHPANQQVLAYLKEKGMSTTISQSPDDVDVLKLGTHPDLVYYVWGLGSGTPASRDWVVYGRPVIIHPDTGVIFGLAIGTSIVALRLPQNVIDGEANHGSKSGIKSTAKDVGDDWAFMQSFDKRVPKLAVQAYEYAGKLKG